MFLNFCVIQVLLGLAYVFINNVIPSYGELNANDCGVNRFSHQVYSECFEWHRDYIPKIFNGRNATIGEVPWITFLRIEFRNAQGDTKATICSGSLISTSWVITAAHCLLKSKDHTFIEAQVQFGHTLLPNTIYPPEQRITSSAQVHIHPEYLIGANKEKDERDLDYKYRFHDIGLLKLNQPIQPDIAVNSICIPSPNFNAGINRYAVVGGWSEWDRNDLSKQVLQMSYRKVVEYPPNLMGSVWDENEDDYWLVENCILSKFVDNKAFLCAGDSGAPLWIYIKGRAILIGVYIRLENFGAPNDPSATPGPTNGRCGDTETDFGLHTNVSVFVDWIKDVVQSN